MSVLLVTKTPSFRNRVATMASYCLIACQERGIIDRPELVESFDEVRGRAGRKQGRPAVSSPGAMLTQPRRRQGHLVELFVGCNVIRAVAA